MTTTTFQPTKEIIYQAASRIFAGLLASGKVNQKSDEFFLRYSIRAAAYMATQIVKADIPVEGGGEDGPFPIQLPLSGATDPWPLGGGEDGPFPEKQ
ncbi:MAG: hypothetical protein KC643_20025 [Nitrospira sp.]|nr:hypothetical protein [Nitrospira sp.]